jgi:transglutaminase superfamily protein
MIAEVFGNAYDATGRAVFRPSKHRYAKLSPNFPMGRHVTQPLTVLCGDLREVRQFLLTCRYISDAKQFGRPDYWMPPEEFERRRQGDCDDWALWTWRQLMRLGYPARFVYGRAGRYGAGHAWVTIERDGRTFIVESLAAWPGSTFPRLSTLRYHPIVSISWDGRTLRYFEHRPERSAVSFSDVAPHIPEWVGYWMRTRALICARLFRWLLRTATRSTQRLVVPDRA